MTNHVKIKWFLFFPPTEEQGIQLSERSQKSDRGVLSSFLDSRNEFKSALTAVFSF